MCKAKEVKHQITNHYTYEGRFYHPNTVDLIKHLLADCIDNFEQSKHPYQSFEVSDDRSLAIFFYEDKSMLVIERCSISVY